MKNSKVLIIDDEPILRETLKKALKNQSYQLYFAENGRTGLEMFYEKSPVLIFLDLRMPVMDGFEFLESVKLKASDPYTIVVVTGHGGDEEIQRSYKLGVHSFLKKPLNMVEVYSLAGRCIKFKEMEIEREKLIAELQDATATIKTMRDLLPICSSCKRIRSDENEWYEMENYIKKYTNSAFTHSICPACVKMLYPELAGEILPPDEN